MDFFVVGTGRCGTRMLRDILNLHSSIYIPHETHWIPTMYNFFGLTVNRFEAYKDILERTYHVTGIRTIDRIMQDFTIEKAEFYQTLELEVAGKGGVSVVGFNQAFYQYCSRLKQKSICGDKTPEFGFYMTLLQQLWPSTRFIHIVRDGRDVALSMSKHAGFQRMVALRINNWCPVGFNGYYRIFDHKDRKGALSALSFLSGLAMIKRPEVPLTEYIRLWESRLTRILDESSRLRPGSYLEVKYEDLLKEPKRAISRIAAFLSLSVSPEWISAAESIIIPNNYHKISDNVLYRALTDVSSETLKRVGYAS
ncbi:MAG: sulfotransferase [Candidatus Omnitrophica bacterium]|nr:sulfotransferase [Candidatus Omnitrophota bacterium]